MVQLKDLFIKSNKEYVEGEVSRFIQRIDTTNVINARLEITALGVYVASMNGHKIGTQLFAPGYTYYPKHLNVQSYDITNLIRNGSNELEVYVGQGWYSGRFSHENKTQIYGKQLAVSWSLIMTLVNDDVQIVTSRDSVMETTNEYIYAGFYDGEIVDKTKQYELIGQAQIYSGLLPENFEQTILPVTQQERIEVIETISLEDGYILDFGQNFAGYIAIDTKLMDQDTIELHHGEILYPEHTLYTNNLRQAKATIKLTKGNTDELYIPHFTYMGFRFVHLKGCTYRDGLIHAYVIHSDMTRTGYFTSANYLVHKLYQNQLWGQKSNYIEVPTDCPQRDERMGYPGDAHAFALTGAYNYDTRLFWTKVLKDMMYSQQDNSEGYIGPHTPALGKTGIGYLNMLGWGNAITIIPEMLYKQYGDESYLTDCFESMKLHVEAEIRQLNDDYLWMGINIGDWLAPKKDITWFAMNNHPVSNSFIINDLRILSEFSKRHGLDEEYQRYHDLYKKVQHGYIKNFVREDGTMQPDYQGAYVMALQHVLQNHPMRKSVMSKFVENVKTNGLETGFFATEHLLPLLIEAGETTLAYDVLLNEDIPGWMYQINKGATTTWERWDAILEDGSINETKITDDNMVSFNHYAFGSVGRFFYQYILGIKPLKPGYKEVLIQPYLDPRLRAVSGLYDSVEGTIEVSWKLRGAQYHIHVKVPTEALIVLPDGKQKNVEYGTYEFHGEYKKENDE